MRWRDVGARGSGVRSEGPGLPAEGAGRVSEGIVVNVRRSSVQSSLCLRPRIALLGS